MMTTSLIRKAAIAQLCSSSDKYSNLAQIAKCAKLAKASGAIMLFLPECFGFMPDVSNGCITLDHAEDLFVNEENGNDSIIFRGLQEIAREHKLWISGGGIHEKIHSKVKADNVDDNDECTSKISNIDRVYNTHIILNEHGALVAKYRKIHLFDVCIPSEGVNLRESSTTAPGDCGIVVVDSPIGKLGLATCYDVRFPEQFTLLKERGAQVLLLPSAFTVPTGKAHWHVLLRARAIEQQCYVLAAAQCGRHNDKRVSYGHSLAIDPWGKILADAGGDDDDDLQKCKTSESKHRSDIIVCDIDLNHLESIRKRMPIDNHRLNAKSFLV